MELIVDVVLLRVGRVLGYMDYGFEGEPDAAEVTLLTEALTAKVHVGDLALP